MAIWPSLPYKNWLRGQGKAIKMLVKDAQKSYSLLIVRDLIISYGLLRTTARLRAMAQPRDSLVTSLMAAET